MQVTLRKNAWYCKIQKFSFPNQELSQNLCPFFWKTIFALLLVPPKVIGLGLAYLAFIVFSVLDFFSNEHYIESWVKNPNYEQFQYITYRAKGNPGSFGKKKLEAYVESYKLNFDKFKTEYFPKQSKVATEHEMYVHGHKLSFRSDFKTPTSFRGFAKTMAGIFVLMYLIAPLVCLVTDGSVKILSYLCESSMAWSFSFILISTLVWLPYLSDKIFGLGAFEAKDKQELDKFEKIIFKVANVINAVLTAISDGIKLSWSFLSASAKKVCPIIEWED